MKNLAPTEIWTALLGLASAFVLLSNAAEKIAKAIQTAKAPNQALNERMDAFEAWKDSVDFKLNADKKRLDIIEKGNSATMRALLALLDHGLDGNNIEQMQSAKKELQNHLINR